MGLNFGDVHQQAGRETSNNYGNHIGGHVVATDHGQNYITTNNKYTFAKGAITNKAGFLDQRIRILNWLSSLASFGFAQQHRANLLERTGETGKWFIEHEKFKAWVDGRIRTLWCHGILGSGKTILSSTIIEHIELNMSRLSPSVACVFVFFGNQEHAKQAPHDLVFDMLRQLVQQQKEISERMRQLYERQDLKVTSPTPDECLEAIEHEISRFSKVWFIIDALDGCPANVEGNWRKQFLQMLAKLPGSVGLLITSRDRWSENYGLHPVEEVEVALNDDDLRKYVGCKIQEHSDDNKLLASVPQDRLIASISEKAKGMFLLARLHMNNIVARSTLAELESSIDDLSTDIQETYQKAVARISPCDAALADNVFQWITFAIQPLTIPQLQHALASKARFDKASAIPAHLPDGERLIRICSGLVIVARETSLITFVHPSAQKYFANRFDSEQSHSQLASCCLKYLLVDDIHQTLEATMNTTALPDLPLLSYAARHWGDHHRQSHDPSIVYLALEFLDNVKSLLTAANAMDSEDPRSISALWVAAHFGLVKVVDQLLLRPNCSISEIMYGETALHAAAEMGYAEVIKRLLREEDIDLTFSNECGRSALSVAAEAGHYSVVQLLLDSGKAEPDCKTTVAFFGSRTPLSWASGNGHHNIVYSLLATNRVDVNSAIQDGFYSGRTPLMWASANGHVKVVELLLNRAEIDINQVDSYGRTALSFAAEYGHGDIIRMFLRKQRLRQDVLDTQYNRTAPEWALESKHREAAEILLTHPQLDHRDEYGRTRLSHEAEMGRIDTVKILIQIRAAVDTKDDEGWTPLAYAVEAGRVDIVQALIDGGCEPDPFDDEGRTPLSHASENGHEDIVQTLLDIGKVNVNSVATSFLHSGRTPLSWACGNGHIKIVEMLIDKDADVNLMHPTPSWGGQSPMMWAKSKGHTAIVERIAATVKAPLVAKEAQARQHGRVFAFKRCIVPLGNLRC